MTGYYESRRRAQQSAMGLVALAAGVVFAWKLLLVLFVGWLLWRLTRPARRYARRLARLHHYNARHRPRPPYAFDWLFHSLHP